MNDYALRYIAQDGGTLIELGVLLGALTADKEGVVTATHGGCWDYIGPIHRPTGTSQEVDGMSVPDMAPITDSENNEYLHANLRTPLNLAEVAKQMAVDNADIAQALSSLGKFFLLDEEGKARQPNQPHRVFA